MVMAGDRLPVILDLTRMKQLEAIIFDFDGVIVDSEPFHFAAFRKTYAEELGLELTRAQYDDRYLAFDDRQMLQVFLADRGVEVSSERFRELLEIKEAHFIEIARDTPVFPGAPELIHSATARWPIAIASGALEREIRPVLEGAGLSECFTALVSAEMVKRGKPDPESYLTALGRINEARGKSIYPCGCLVIEDSLAGVDSGHAAGMYVLAVTNSLPRERLKGADRIVDSLEEVGDVDALAAWFANLP